MFERSRVGAILLAGGASRGLGHPKQLVIYEGKTLIRRSAEMLVASTCDPIIVVLGALVDECLREIDDLPVTVCINEQWDVGISSGISAGLNRLANAEAALIALCDQPFVTTADYDALVEEYSRTRPDIVAAAYDDVVGVPALFDKKMFPDLLSLNGDEGARYLVRRNPDRTRTVPIPGAGFDVDSPDDEDDLRYGRITL